MNRNTFPTHTELKIRAKKTMGQTVGACCALGLAMVLASYGANWFLQNSGGTFDLYFWDAATNDIQNSFSLTEAGLFAALRMEEYAMGLSIAITPSVVLMFLLVRLVVTAVLAPLSIGSLDNLWAIQHGAPKRFREVFRWYGSVKRAGSAIVLQVFLWVEQMVLTVLFSIPALAVLYLLPMDLFSANAAIWLLLGARAVVWCIMTQFQPIRYQLARSPEQGVRKALRYGRAILTHRHGQYLKFRLSFLIWELLDTFSQGVFQFYLFPYQGLANMNWLDEMEKQAGREYNQ